MRGPPRNQFGAILESAIREWPNLRFVTFAPTECHKEVFTGSLVALATLRHLQHLTIDWNCCNEASQCASLGELRGLQSLIVIDPTRALLNMLPDWLSQLKGTLTRFSMQVCVMPDLKHDKNIDTLQHNCGSVTPGVLKQILPAISELQSFSLGLSYSVVNGELFSFISHMHNLTSLELRYYIVSRQSSSNVLLMPDFILDLIATEALGRVSRTILPQAPEDMVSRR